MVMKNIETKWLYDFLTLEACRHFFLRRQKSVIFRNPHSADELRRWGSDRRCFIRSHDHPLQLTEEGKLFHSQTRSLLQQLECNLGS